MAKDARARVPYEDTKWHNVISNLKHFSVDILIICNYGTAFMRTHS